MTILESMLDTQSAAFLEQRRLMLEKIEEVQRISQSVHAKAETQRERFAKKKKLLPHERIQRLLDPGSPFLEICPLAGYMMHDDKDGSEAGGGIISGIGFVGGVRCMVSANNSAIKGGTITPAGLKKTLRLQEVILQNRLPSVVLSESGGANLNYAAEIFVEGARTFANQARISAAGLPQVTIVHGNATAGGAYQPGLSDYVIAIRQRTAMFLAGPPLLLAATGEVATEEDLGGAVMHAQVAGTAEYLAEDDADAITIARDVVTQLGWNDRLPAPCRTAGQEPRYAADDLLGIVPSDSRTPYDTREIIARIADNSEFLEFKNDYDEQTVCGWLRVGGISCGYIGNNGPITPQGASKAAQFIQLCDQTGRPLLFFHNTTGFMVGTDSEQNGVIKHGSKMIQAVANCRVPKISIVIGGSYGAGNYAMCGRGLDPHFIFSWPNSKTAVMGGAQAGKVLRQVTEAKQLKMGMTPDPNVLTLIEQSAAHNLDAQSTALFNTAHLNDDGIIDPRDTRKVLLFVLDTIDEAQRRSLHPNSYGVARF
ncbi:MAG: acyl-CoA carboxylase subunit beta [Pseudomonadales bacterium]|nr:acyl-CoA carboxylase subunit beta [Pseudomonadales bacterium]